LLIGHLADVHLGARLYGRQELREDTLRAFENAIDVLINEKVDVIVIAGDLFDQPRPDNYFLLGAIRILKRVKEHGIKVILAGGDHDTPKVRDRSPLEIIAETLEGVYYPNLQESSSLETLIVNIDGIDFAVVPFPRGSSELKKKFFNTILPALESIIKRRNQKRSVLVGHFGVDEACKWDSVVPASRLPKAFKYIALGHVHTRVISRGCNNCPLFAYPGSLYPLRIDEVMSSHIRGPLIVDMSSDEPIIHQPKVEIRKHYVAKISFKSEDMLRERLRAKIMSYANTGAKEPVIHLDIEVPTSIRSLGLIRSLISELEKELGTIIIYRILPHKKVPEKVASPYGVAGIDEIELISKFLAGDRTLSKLVLELKSALASGGEEEKVKKILDELLNEKNYEIWKRILRGLVQQ